jgi:hypothetical protein
MDITADTPKITLSLEMLAALYDNNLVEIVHGIADADRVSLRVSLPNEHEPIELKLPAGNYLLLRVTTLPTTRRGIFAVQSPESLGGKPKGQSRGQT